ncbi:unnamed protein product [Acanthoscelides obtectus]|uniref:Uncharacterized protein n=1 Tax=Acanthoscelides obtectus TaxID=200917 RepID=A0A9P0KQI8_ACAOB|nr:unnamed protein product [Acanthoscelides obtectus]CAK1656242.1 hypothetical protein AOBTE_LOCUS19625 [Acanthoscelides obtectus]
MCVYESPEAYNQAILLMEVGVIHSHRLYEMVPPWIRNIVWQVQLLHCRCQRCFLTNHCGTLDCVECQVKSAQNAMVM